MVQLAPWVNAEGLIGQLSVWEKLVTRAPVIEILLMTTETDPTFLTVMAWGWLAVPLVTVPKLRLVGEKLTSVPVPVRDTVCAPVDPLSTMLNVPVTIPAWFGAKPTLMVQLAFASRLPEQSLFCTNEALATMLEIVTELLPVLLSVAACVALVTFTT
jgi:hypothetical protein